MRRLVYLLLWTIGLLTLFVLFCNIWIVVESQHTIIPQVMNLKPAEVGLVFGTSHHLVGGRANPFFDHRVLAAKSLLRSGKIHRLILSGSKDSIYYDEAEQMKKALLKEGIDMKHLILDKYGNRTLESLQRLKEVHGYTECILITQEYHAYRSAFIARHLGLKVQCYVADTPNRVAHSRALLRELFARTKAVLDLFILRL